MWAADIARVCFLEGLRARWLYFRPLKMLGRTFFTAAAARPLAVRPRLWGVLIARGLEDFWRRDRLGRFQIERLIAGVFARTPLRRPGTRAMAIPPAKATTALGLTAPGLQVAIIGGLNIRHVEETVASD